MKRFLIAFTLFTFLFSLGCVEQQSGSPSSQGDVSKSNETFRTAEIVKPPLKVIATIYPIYEIFREVGGSFVQPTLLVPAGAEPHDYEPTPQDLVRFNQADLVAYNGSGLEPWADKVMSSLQQSGIKTLNMSDIFRDEMIVNEHADDHEEEHADEHEDEHTEEHEHLQDPHFWIDPVNFRREVQFATKKLAEVDPVHAVDYEKNAASYVSKLEELDQSYRTGLKNCDQNTFLTNHAAFAYLARRYQLTMLSISGISPEAEPSAKTIADLVKVMKEKNIRTVLTESLVSPKIAETLAQEAGAKTLVLNPLEGLTDDEIARGENYLTVMGANLKTLQTALQCR